MGTDYLVPNHGSRNYNPPYRDVDVGHGEPSQGPPPSCTSNFWWFNALGVEVVWGLDYGWTGSIMEVLIRC